MGRLGDEYKILQDKVDEIGGFRVTIKGWSVTATIAGLVAIATGKGFSPTVSSFAVDVLLISFWWFERRQVKLGWLFNNRIRRIEIEIDKRRKEKGEKVTFSSPNIARSLFGRKKSRELIWHVFTTSWAERWRRNINENVRLAWKADVLFYILLIGASWLPEMLLHPLAKEPLPVSPVYIQNTVNVPNPTAPRSAPSVLGHDRKEHTR